MGGQNDVSTYLKGVRGSQELGKNTSRHVRSGTEAHSLTAREIDSEILRHNYHVTCAEQYNTG